jgi:hypothetical protein
MESIAALVSAILSPLIWVLSTIFAILWWVVSYLLWAILWLLLPFALVAFVALRMAEKILGPEMVRAWIKRQSLKFGAGTWVRARRLTFALGALPLRVLGYLVIYTIWHSIIGLFWKPRWHPWTRAWNKRWKPAKVVRRKSPTPKATKAV